MRKNKMLKQHSSKTKTNRNAWLLTPLAMAVSAFAAGSAQASTSTDLTFGTNGVAPLNFTPGNSYLTGFGMYPESVNMLLQPTIELSNGDLVSFASRYEEVGTSNWNTFYNPHWCSYMYGCFGGTFGYISYGNLVSGSSVTRMSRFNSGGAPVSTVDIGGVQVASALEQADGKLLMMGNDLTRGAGSWQARRGYGDPTPQIETQKPLLKSQVVLQRFNADGTADTGFDGDGVLRLSVPGTRYAVGMALAADQKIYVLSVNHDATYSTPDLLRFNADGSVDTSFGGGDGDLPLSLPNAWGLLKLQNNQLLVNYHEGSTQSYALLNPDGSLDVSFAGDGTLNTSAAWDTPWLASMLQQTDGKLLFSSGESLYRYNVNGAYEATINVPSNQVITSLAVFPGGVLAVSDRQADNLGQLWTYSNNGTSGSAPLIVADIHLETGTYSQGTVFFQSTNQVIFSGISDTGEAVLNRHSFPDTDGDGVNNLVDNCPLISNADQLDADSDGVGDACDAFPNDTSETLDADGDGVGNNGDNCPSASNANQLDTDSDGIGDVCDSTPNGDTDSDGVDNLTDNCPLVANANQTDTDGDGTGDACDATPNGPDTDGDGIPDASDNCPNVANANQLDTDGDAQGDVCDSDIDGDGVPNAGGVSTQLIDGFESGDLSANAWVGSAVVVSGGHTGSYAAHIGSGDLSLTGTFAVPTTLVFYAKNMGTFSFTCPAGGLFNIDGVPYDIKASTSWFMNTFLIPAGTHTLQWQGQVCHPRFGLSVYSDIYLDDITSTLSITDNCPLVANANQLDTDGDGLGNACDSTPSGDTDGDGVDNLTDNCPLVANANQTDTDSDGTGDVCDAFPNNASETVDSDGDGVGDNSDAFPNDATETTDTDGDGVGDNSDNCPAVSNANQLDTDGNGFGDACDANTKGSAEGAHAGDNTGTSVVLADMNNDGYDDLVIGSPLVDVSTSVNGKTVVMKDAGNIKIISGADGSTVLGNFNGTKAGQQFGTAIAIVPDQNSDGIPDLIVGNSLAEVTATVNAKTVILKDAGNVSVYSGADGSFIQSIADGNKAGDHFGAALAVDEHGNVMVGAPLVDISTVVSNKTVILKDIGRVTVFNGLSSNILYTRDGTQAGEHFGSAVAVNTIDHQLLIGSPTYDVSTVVNTKTIKLTDAGRVQVFDATDLTGLSATLQSVYGAAKGDQFGAALSSFDQDVDGDNQTDWVVGIPGANILDPLTNKIMNDAGKVQIFSGLNSTAIFEMAGETAGETFGASVCASGDINGDDDNDLAVGVPKFDVPTVINNKATTLKDAGLVEVMSGAEF